ncbi:recombinase family protein [Faecalibacterium prausnitzii]|uniref:recombinase family protein n=1 Tax=Faecalibacterium prausnitzii TaxID=853 RepID=UPI0031B80A61
MRTAVYARVSTEHEAQINALENQLEWYKIECSRHSDWEIVEVYVDQGITGTQAQKRPEFLRMMEDAQKGKFDIIITREVSRFARNTVDTLSYTRELKARGVDVFFINDGINTATNDGELRLTIMSSMAQDESRKISERVKAGQKISRENGTYVPDPDQAETVRLIFQMYSTGENGLVKIVNELYRLGRLDAGGHVSWDASKVSRVLHNATYKGCISLWQERLLRRLGTSNLCRV